MTLDIQANPFDQTGVETELARFLIAIRTKIQQDVGDDTSLVALRRAARAARIGWSLAGPQMPVVATPDFGQLARLYRPADSHSSSLMIYLHGGGWVMLDLDTHDRMMRHYALQTGCNVLGLDYPLAPEAKFPENLFACADAIERVIENATAIGVNPDRIILGGDSSGANLALSVALHRQSIGCRPLAGLVLNYGVFDSDLTRPSYKRFGLPPYLLTQERIEFFWASYCRSDADLSDPLAAPLRADPATLAGLPPTHLTIARQDALLDENLLLAEKLRAAGVDVSHMVYDSAAHGFLEAVHHSPVADRALADTVRWMKQLTS